MTWTGIADLSLKLLTPVIAVGGAWVALANLRTTVRTRTADFLLTLHKAFFMEGTYSILRCLLDDPGDSAREQMAVKVREESDDLIAFLNFFELVAYMRVSRALTYADVHALPGYSLRLLLRNEVVNNYIEDKQKSFEHLAALLREVGATLNVGSRHG